MRRTAVAIGVVVGLLLASTGDITHPLVAQAQPTPKPTPQGPPFDPAPTNPPPVSPPPSPPVFESPSPTPAPAESTPPPSSPPSGGGSVGEPAPSPTSTEAAPSPTSSPAPPAGGGETGGSGPEATPTPTPTPEETPSPTPTPSPTETPPPSDVVVEANLTLRYRPRQDAFKGAVLAQRPVSPTQGYGSRQTTDGSEVDYERCERYRRVKLFRFQKGPDSPAGRDLTNAKGRWEIPKRDPKAKYYAVVQDKAFEGPDGSKIICDGARSGSYRAPRQ